MIYVFMYQSKMNLTFFNCFVIIFLLKIFFIEYILILISPPSPPHPSNKKQHFLLVFVYENEQANKKQIGPEQVGVGEYHKKHIHKTRHKTLKKKQNQYTSKKKKNQQNKTKTKTTTPKMTLSLFCIGHLLLAMGPDLNCDLNTQ